MPNHILRRGAVYFYRRRLPAALDGKASGSYFVKTLKTRCRRTALRLARQIDVRIDEMSDLKTDHPTDVSSSPTLASPIRIPQIPGSNDCHSGHMEGVSSEKPAHDWVTDWLSGWCFYAPKYDKKIIDRFLIKLKVVFECIDVPLPEDCDRQSVELIQRERADLENRILAASEHARKTHSFRYTDTIESCLEDALFDLQLQVESAGAAWERLLLKAIHFAAEHVLERRDEARRLAAAGRQPTPTERSEAVEPAQLMSVVFKDCIDSLNGGKWRECKTDRDARLAAERLIEIIGDKPIDQFTIRDASKFKKMLRRLPAHTKHKPYCTLNIVESISLREKLDSAGVSEKELKALGIPSDKIEALSKPISERTLQKNISFAHQLFEWAKANGELCYGNPFDGLRVPDKAVKEDNVKRNAGRKGFTTIEKDKIFSTTAFTSYRHENYRHRPGSQQAYDSKFWWPLLVNGTGGRSEEIAAARLSDIFQKDGIWVIDITPHETRLLKNEDSQRLIPIHKNLIAIGFLDYVADIKAAGSVMLFPELKPNKSGSYSDTIGEWFGRYLSHIGIKIPGKRMHAFRRSMITEVINAGFSRTQAELLAGHKLSGSSTEDYFDGLNLATAKKAIDAIYMPINCILPYQSKSSRS